MSDTLTKQQSKRPSVVVRRKSGQGKVGKAGGGLVDYCVHGPSGKRVAADFAPSKLIEALREGLPVQELDALQAILDVPMEKLGTMLGISRATLHRRKGTGKLDPAESDRVVRFARLMGKAMEVMESEKNAR